MRPRRPFLPWATLPLVAVALTVDPVTPPAAEAAPGNRDALGSSVRLGRLHYGGGGDWYANPTSLPNLAQELRSRLDMDVEVEEGRVAPLDDELFDFPVLHMTGHGNVRFTSDEAERLRWYLVHGGFLFADDNYGMDETFRPELRKLFPEAELVVVPFDHDIYHSIYEFPKGLPKIHEHHGGPPQGLAIFYEGRMVVFYSYNTDIGDGLEDEDVHGDSPEAREQAMRMAINVVAYAMTH
ncbi:MAG: hypothetical protein DHS20C21_16810 [Gemmatimonadota bacterium]|nr:MAG: hypothetical protein DHS20C21_16810 [Gemmatimonadota bacterium]